MARWIQWHVLREIVMFETMVETCSCPAIMGNSGLAAACKRLATSAASTMRIGIDGDIFWMSMGDMKKNDIPCV